MKKKKSIALATLLATLSSAPVTPVAFADEWTDWQTPDLYDDYEINKDYDDEYVNENCLSCITATYCTPGCQGGPSFQNCPSCIGREGPQGTTELADTVF